MEGKGKVFNQIGRWGVWRCGVCEVLLSMLESSCSGLMYCFTVHAYETGVGLGESSTHQLIQLLEHILNPVFHLDEEGRKLARF